LSAILEHLRRNVVAYIALFVAVGGTSYAAINIPNGSVGERQLKNHSIDPIKLDPKYMGGYVRAWASVNANGKVFKASGEPGVTTPVGPPGHFLVIWNTHPDTSCVAVANVDERSGAPAATVPGFALPETTSSSAGGVETSVGTFNAQGQLAALPFDVALICSTPH
jgi:hypothetical protein